MASSNTVVTFVAGRLFTERQWIFRFLYFTAQEKAPDIWCLLMSEGQSRSLGMQTSPAVGVYFSRWSQSQNDNEPRGRVRLRVNW